MARPKPTILNVHTDKSYMQTQIIAGDNVFFVTFMGQPINVMIRPSLFDDVDGKPVTKKYMRTSFINKGSAILLVDKLNKKFNTDEFKVAKSVSFVHI